MRRARFHAERDTRRYHQAQVAALALIYSREADHSPGRTTVLSRDPAIPSDVRVPSGYRGAVCAKLASDRIERGAARPGYSFILKRDKPHWDARRSASSWSDGFPPALRRPIRKQFPHDFRVALDGQQECAGPRVGRAMRLPITQGGDGQMKRLGKLDLRHVETLSEHLHVRHTAHPRQLFPGQRLRIGVGPRGGHDLRIGQVVDPSPMRCSAAAHLRQLPA